MKKLCAFALIALLVFGMASFVTAGAEYYDDYDTHRTSPSARWVTATAKTQIRTAPSSDAPALGSASVGMELEYMDRTENDGRGGLWYCVYLEGYLGWISARDAELQ